MLVSFLAGSSAPTRLDSFFQVQYGYPPTMLSIVYGIYAAAAFLSLLIIGSLSDYIGRRPVLIAAALLQATAMWVCSRVTGALPEELIVARIVQGIAIGGALSALGAGMLDVDRAKGSIASVIASMLGIAIAGLVDSLLQSLPNPVLLVYAVFGAIFVAQAIGVVLISEPLSVRAGALAWLRPSCRLARELRRPRLLVTPALAASSAMLGFYCWCGAPLLRYVELTKIERASGGWIFYAPGSPSPSRWLALGGLTLFAFGGGAAAALFLTRKRSDQTRLGMVLLLVGSGVTMLAIRILSSPLLFVACMIAGAGTGAGLQAAMRGALLLASPPQRAALLSVLYLVACVATALLAGLASLQIFGRYSLFEYLSWVMALAVVTLVGALRRRARELAA